MTTFYGPRMWLSFTAMAVTREEADTYADARGVVDWTGTNTAKDQALRRGQDYIAGVYNNRWTGGYLEGVWVEQFDDTNAPAPVKYAICEAAIRELTVPFSLTPDVVLGKEKVLTSVGRVSWTALRPNASAADMRPTLTIINDLLSGWVRAAGVVEVVRA